MTQLLIALMFACSGSDVEQPTVPPIEADPVAEVAPEPVVEEAPALLVVLTAIGDHCAWTIGGETIVTLPGTCPASTAGVLAKPEGKLARVVLGDGKAFDVDPMTAVATELTEGTGNDGLKPVKAIEAEAGIGFHWPPVFE